MEVTWGPKPWILRQHHANPMTLCCDSKRRLMSLRKELKKTNDELELERQIYTNESCRWRPSFAKKQGRHKKGKNQKSQPNQINTVLKEGCEKSLLMMKEEYEEKLRKRESAYKQNSASDMDCTICYCPIEGDLGVTSLDGGHKCHTSCILNWFAGGKNTCCNCRHQQRRCGGQKESQMYECDEENCERCYHITFEFDGGNCS